MKAKKETAFIVELFLLFALMLLVTVVLTSAFVSSRMQSLYARHKTEAVIIAERIAEVSMASEDLDEALELISGMEDVTDLDRSGSGAEFTARISDTSADEYRVKLDWDGQTDGSVSLSTQKITVYYGEDGEPIYVLDSGSFRKEAGRGK